MKKHFLIIIVLVTLISCGLENDKKRGSDEPTSTNVSTQPEQLNITLLLDLSDRIDPKKNPEKPEHYKRDISIVQHFSELFVKDMEKRGTYMAKGKIKVIFSPKPQDPNVNLYAEKLSVDLSQMDIKQKKEIHDSITSIFTDNISKIYNATISQSKWIGSDIWRFFKNDVKDYCVDNDANYRNILVILTDGYIFHQDSKDQNGNRYSYLLPNIISKYNLRKNSNWQQEIDRKDFGLITKRNDLDNLEVLVLEVTPSPNYKDDEDIIKYVLAKWFKEMKVKRFGIYNSDLPEYTKQRINDFIKE
jgi:hypothetical protein